MGTDNQQRYKTGIWYSGYSNLPLKNINGHIKQVHKVSGSKPTLKFKIVNLSPDYSEIENRRYRLNMKINISAKLWHMGLFFGGFGFESYRKFYNFFVQFL